MGWRYTMITLGGLSLAFTFIRIFIFNIPETPRYLLSHGRDQDAVEAVNYVARQNGKPEPLTIGMLRDIDARLGATSCEGETRTKLSTKAIISENMESLPRTTLSSSIRDAKIIHSDAHHLVYLAYSW
jgi:hypothetical protein